MDFTARLQNLEKKINDNKIQKAKLEEKRDNLEAEYKKLLAELEAEGIKEADLATTIANIEKEVAEEIGACEESLK